MTRSSVDVLLAREAARFDALPAQALSAAALARLGLDASLAGLVQPGAQLVMREPELAEARRWLRHAIAGRSYQVAQPVTFTPYAATRPCSARCLFCSENLRPLTGSVPAATLRPAPDYFEQLARALFELRGLPLSYSLSGLETTDDPGWMCAMLDLLEQHAGLSPVEQSVLYTNGAGLAAQAGERLIARLRSFGLGWVELSRHHFDAATNQRIMRFREQVSHSTDAGFDALLARLCEAFLVKLVCIVQRGGIDSGEALCSYLQWAQARGVKRVIVREFSRLSAAYRSNGTARYIDAARVDVAGLLRDTAQQLGARLQLHTLTAGYYFWNVIGSYADMQVTFEVSDYARMQIRHDSQRIYKLVFHANGVLCAGWDPSQHVLFDARRVFARAPEGARGVFARAPEGALRPPGTELAHGE